MWKYAYLLSSREINEKIGAAFISIDDPRNVLLGEGGLGVWAMHFLFSNF